ncbi:MAG: hypothetical protein RXN88_03870 [Acidilobus sp.]
MRAQANSLVWGLGNTVGGAVGALIGGLLLQGRGFLGLTPIYSTMWMFAAFAIASSAMLFMLPRGRPARRP